MTTLQDIFTALDEFELAAADPAVDRVVTGGKLSPAVAKRAAAKEKIQHMLVDKEHFHEAWERNLISEAGRYKDELVRLTAAHNVATETARVTLEAYRRVLDTAGDLNDALVPFLAYAEALAPEVSSLEVYEPLLGLPNAVLLRKHFRELQAAVQKVREQ